MSKEGRQDRRSRCFRRREEKVVNFESDKARCSIDIFARGKLVDTDVLFSTMLSHPVPAWKLKKWGYLSRLVIV